VENIRRLPQPGRTRITARLDSGASADAQAFISDYAGTFKYRKERALSPGTVTNEKFGKIAVLPVDG